jgi:hypothetical protein
MSQVAFKNAEIVSIQQLREALNLMHMPFVENAPVPDAQWSSVRNTICAVAVAGDHMGTPEGMGWRVSTASGKVEQVMDHTYINLPEATAFAQRVQQYCQLADVIVQLTAYNTNGGQAQYQIVQEEDGTLTVDLEVS